MREYLLCGLVAAAVTVLATGAVRGVAGRFGVVAAIRDRDVHDVPIPRLGGVAILAGLLASFLVAAHTPLLHQTFADGEPQALAWAGLVICAIGVVDDIWGLDALTKLAGQALAAGLMSWQGVQIVWLPWPGQTISLGSTTGTLVTVVVVMVTVNAVNFVDGLDGLAAGIVGIAASAFFVFSYVLSVQNSLDRALTPSLVSAALVGVCVGFLVHNFNPARIFMGDSGSMLLGLMLAACTITLTGRVPYGAVTTLGLFPAVLPLLLPFAVLAVPFADLALAVVRRTRGRRSPFSADKQHLHHRLLEIGHSQRRAVLIMYSGTALLAYGALAFAVLRPAVAAGVVAVGAVLLVVLVRHRPSAPPGVAGAEAAQAGTSESPAALLPPAPPAPPTPPASAGTGQVRG